MFTNATLSTSNWLQQKDHGSSTATRPVPVQFSFVSRSSLVAYSLVYRGPIEDRTRIGRISNERRTKEDREDDEKPSKTQRKTAKPDGEWQPSVFVKPNEQNRTSRMWGKVNEVGLT